MRRIVLKNDLDSVSDLRTNERAENAKVHPGIGSRFQRVETCVGVLVENRFPVNGCVRIQRSLGSRIILEVIFLVVDSVLAGRSIVPIHFVGGNVVGTNTAWVRDRLWLGNRKRRHQHEREQQAQFAQKSISNEKVEQSYAR